MYVQNYEIISDLKAAKISAFQEMSDGMVTLTMENLWRIKKKLQTPTIENKVVCVLVCSIY